jgi:uncharacterized protein YqgV (UPF0045/DUF77 family)
MIACQMSLYPLGSGEFTALIAEAVDSLEPLEDRGLSIDVGSMSTVVTGPDDLVWEAARLLFDTAAKDGNRVVLTSTFSNECGLPPSAARPKQYGNRRFAAGGACSQGATKQECQRRPSSWLVVRAGDRRSYFILMFHGMRYDLRAWFSTQRGWPDG